MTNTGKNFMKKELAFALTAVAIIAIVVMYYSHKTACPNVAVYVKCKDLF